MPILESKNILIDKDISLTPLDAHTYTMKRLSPYFQSRKVKIKHVSSNQAFIPDKSIY